MKQFRAKQLGTGQAWLGFLVTLLFAAALLATNRAIGYARDEGFYFGAGDQYCKWLKLLLSDPQIALTRESIDGHFVVNHEHPPLMKMLFGVCHELLHSQFRWFARAGTAYRFPAMLTASLGVAVLFHWGTRAISPIAGVLAGAAFATIPRVFHHAHLACFDVPIAVFCLLTAYSWSRAMESGKLRWVLASGLAFGLALATKHNAWLLPPALLLHGVCCKWRLYRDSAWRHRWRLLLPAVALGTLGPLVLLMSWPWLWFDTLGRLQAWFLFHHSHAYYDMEFLGHTYFAPPMPRAYAWVMTLATVPTITLACAALGVGVALRSVGVKLLGRLHERARTGELTQRDSDVLLWIFCAIAAYAPWLSAATPIFGGTKHWFTAYPFLCLLAAFGAERLLEQLPAFCPRVCQRPSARTRLQVVISTLLVSPGLVRIWDMGPWGLSDYSPLVGGAPGAASLGLNRTFWGSTATTLASELRILPTGRVFIHDMSTQSWRAHVQERTLPEHLQPSLAPANSDVAIYQHEPHMARIEYQIWSAYGTQTPVAIRTHEGVPILWLYHRAERR